MKFGEKLQQLRKGKGMSQEQLAEQMDVSRQAVSKWELNTATPEVQNILRLSKIFEVSTDELLCNGAGYKKPAAEGMGRYMEAISIVSLGILAGGLVFSIASWWEWQYVFITSIGLLIQLAGIVLFEISIAALARESREKTAQRRKRMYSTAVWLVMPFIIIFIYDKLRFLVPFGYPSFIDDVMKGAAYIFICGGATWLLQTRKKEH